MCDLDHILAEQYHSARRRLKTVSRLRKIFNYKKDLDLVEASVHNNIKFFETMIYDKRLLKKKPKLRTRTDDILSKNTTRSLLKYAFAYSSLSYRMMLDYWQAYVSFWQPR